MRAFARTSLSGMTDRSKKHQESGTPGISGEYAVLELTVSDYLFHREFPNQAWKGVLSTGTSGITVRAKSSAKLAKEYDLHLFVLPRQRGRADERKEPPVALV
ncbi:MAG: hypothetical protein U5K84_05315 [Alkalibacterium sp.]|nr:hypothetical protein [Alkalibacterium sp.]